MNSGNEITVRGLTGKFGLQYEQRLGGDMSMIIGATYRLGTDMKGYSKNFRYATQSNVVDSLKYTVDTLSAAGMKFGDEIGVGISVKNGEKWSAELNYIRSDWSNSGFDKTSGFNVAGQSTFSSTVSQSFRAGFEFIPNRNDIRYYFKRCTYRFGAYYDQSYYKLDGNNVNSMGVTFGMTLPVHNYHNGISLGMDIGQRANMKNPSMIRERYVSFVIGFNIHDIWFRKVQYQ